MGKGGRYEMIDGVEVLVEAATRPSPDGSGAASPPESNDTEFSAISANAETEFPLVAATPPIAAPGGKRGHGGPSAAVSAPPLTEEK